MKPCGKCRRKNHYLVEVLTTRTFTLLKDLKCFLRRSVYWNLSGCVARVSHRTQLKDVRLNKRSRKYRSQSSWGTHVHAMKNTKKHNNVSKKAKFKPGSKKRENKCVVTFDDKDRQDYLTGFHKRKVERRKAAVAEIRKKIKEEQIRVREERHKEYIKMLKERTEALEEAEDDLEDAITGTTEAVQYDHPNHTVTVTTISDLDLTGGHLLGLATSQANGEREDEERGNEEEEKTKAMPKRAGNPIVNKKIRSLTAALSTYTSKRKRKGKQEGRGRRGRLTDKRPAVAEGKNRNGRTSKRQRRRQTGKRGHHDD